MDQLLRAAAIVLIAVAMLTGAVAVAVAVTTIHSVGCPL